MSVEKDAVVEVSKGKNNGTLLVGSDNLCEEYIELLDTIGDKAMANINDISLAPNKTSLESNISVELDVSTNSATNVSQTCNEKEVGDNNINDENKNNSKDASTLNPLMHYSELTSVLNEFSHEMFESSMELCTENKIDGKGNQIKRVIQDCSSGDDSDFKKHEKMLKPNL